MHLMEGELDPVGQALESGMSPDVRVEGDGWTLLHTVCHGAYTHAPKESLEYLIEMGVPVNATDVAGCTALHYAASYENDVAVRVLLNAGCRVDPIDSKGMTPLHHAVMVHPYPQEVIKSLLAAGADINHGAIRDLVEGHEDSDRQWILKTFEKYS